ncbi:MAG TPA: protein kinase [Kofleriaceae bacterium]|nr:protein kinase [Kofleriaceae bacterium]
MRRGELIDDRFEVDEHVATGGMGQVFRARDVQTGEQVAVKLMLGDQGAHLARFEHERKALSLLSHPGIVRYIAHGRVASGSPYLAMEWLQGEDLASRLSRGKLSLEDSLALATAVAAALGAAHAQGIIHRDLKPSNIFLTDGKVEQAKVLDFGIARLATVTRVTIEGAILGTLGYMAPEQASTDRLIDARADVYSLGCVLFECLTGAPVFQAEHPLALLAKLVLADPPRLHSVLPTAPEALDVLLWRMMSKEPAERPPHGRAVVEELASLGSHVVADLRTRSSPALTLAEQRLISIILIRGEDRSSIGSDQTLGDTQLVQLEQVDSALRQGAASWGGRLEQLRDGSVVVAIGGTGLVTDQAAQVARCALWLRARAPGRLMTLATGRGEATGRMPAAETIDRAAAMLFSIAAAAGDAARDVRDGIAIDEVTARLLDARFDVRERSGAYTLHGEQELVEGTRVLLGRATPCVGRDPELRTLEQLFQECVEEPAARAAIVTAPPGVGKSRLAQELLRAVRARGDAVTVQIGRGEPHRAGSAFSLLSQLIDSACGIHGSEPIPDQQAKIRAKVAERIEESERQRVAEFLAEIIGAPFPDDDSLPLRVARQDAQLMTEQTRTAFLDFLRAETEANPVVLLLEDVHWGDRTTVAFLDIALRDLRDQPLFVLALARPEVHELFPKLWAERHIQEIPLKQLGKKASERLIRHVLGDNAGREIIDRLVRLSEGNAFYLEELIRAVAEGQRDDLPKTVVTMVQSRLRALDDDARRLLRAASVFGEVFWAGAVSRLLGLPRRAAVLRLDELTDRELISRQKQSRFAGEEAYAFRHALLREGAYTMLTPEDRSLGHRLAGEWLEEHAEEDPLALAEHFEIGGVGESAALYYLRAAEQASQGGDVAAVIARAKRALDCGMPDELRIRCLGVLCELRYYTMDLQGEALPDAEEVMRLAQPGTGPWSQGMLIKILCNLQAGKIDEFMTLLGIVGETQPAPDAATPWATCAATGIFLLDLMGITRKASQLLQVLAANVRASGEREPILPVIHHAILTTRKAFADDDPMQGLEHAEALFRSAEAVGQRRFMEYAKTLIGMNRWYLGLLEGTERIIMEVTLSDKDAGVASSYRAFALAWMLADRGSLDEAREWADRLIEAGRTRGLPADEARGHWVRAEVLRRTAELASADTEIGTALAVLRMACPLDVPGALATFAAVRLAQGRAPEALAATQEGLAKVEELAACGFFRRSFLGLIHAQCLEAIGDHQAAQAAIAQARARLFAIGAKIADPEIRRSFLEVVPENRQILELARQWVGPAEPADLVA